MPILTVEDKTWMKYAPQRCNNKKNKENKNPFKNKNPNHVSKWDSFKMTYFKKIIHYHASLGVGSIWLLKRSIIFQKPRCAIYLGRHVPSAFMNCVVPMTFIKHFNHIHPKKLPNI
jgi:hypothetical protein